MSKGTPFNLGSLTRVATVTLAVVAAASAQITTGDVLFSVADPRPLAKAAEQIESRYGIPIYYEDPAYTYSGDLVTKGKALIPKGGSVTFKVLAGTKIAGPMDLAPVLQAALNSHAQAGNPGQFAQQQVGNALAIVPTGVRSTNSVWIPDQSPLNTQISFPNLQRSGMQTLELICNYVTNMSGVPVMLGTVPTQLLETQTVSIGAQNESARSVLIRMLAGLQWSDARIITPIYKMSWQLFYAPDMQKYFLNFHQVMIETIGPTGRNVRRPVVR